MQVAGCPLLLRLWLIITGLLVAALSSHAHEVRPAYLALQETSPNSFSVVWKRPATANTIPNISPLFPAHCDLTLHPLAELTDAAKIEHGSLTCAKAGLHQGEIRIQGQAITLVDVLIRIQWRNGEVRQHLLNNSAPALSLDKVATPPVADYIVLGLQHILSGYDHLLFVLALLMIVTGKIALLTTITAFTLAHSISLALASLGLVNISPAPVEAAIALSIALLAGEAIYKRRGLSSLATTKPWLMALLFGLLHGLGFAGALTDIGLPQGDIPLALLLFNLGIELGQLLFVSVVLGLLMLMQRILASDLSQWLYVPAYGIGVIGVFWALQRSAAIVA